MIYVTSMPIDRQIIEYYLALLPGVIPSHARARLTLLVGRRLLAAPAEREAARAATAAGADRRAIPNRDRCHLIPYNTTALERDVALTLGIPMYGADPRLADLGTKTGCRRLFAEEGVPHPLGARTCTASTTSSTRSSDARERADHGRGHRQAQRGRVRRGNALVDLRGLAGAGAPDERAAVSERVLRHAAGVADDAVRGLLAKFERARRHRRGAHRRRGATQPERAAARPPDGAVELLSTHDQLLGGPSGQSYLGCRSPPTRRTPG